MEREKEGERVRESERETERRLEEKEVVDWFKKEKIGGERRREKKTHREIDR